MNNRGAMSTGLARVQLVDCVVSPEWAAALASASITGHLQAALARPDLWLEVQLLEKLLYKNANQHRGALHYQRLQEVRRLLGLLRAQQLDRQVAALHEALAVAQQRGALPAGGVLISYGGDQRRVPSHEAAVGVLHSLAAACQLIEQLAPAVQRASLQLLAQLAHSFFMPLCLSSLAVMSRIQVLAGQLLLDAVRAYNTIAEVAALLPPCPAAASAAAGCGVEAASSAGTDGGWGVDLPQLLRAQWRQGLPQLERVPCATGESLAEQAAATLQRYALHLVQPNPAAAAASAVVLEEGPAVAAPQRKRLRGQHGTAATAPVLAVVEDRGVPISREAFAAAAVAAAPGSAAAGAATAAAGAPAAAAGAPAAAAPSGPVEPLGLLGVVEDSAPEEDAAGTVASLMEGEARGHLYRRAALGLGPLSKQQPPPQLAKAPMRTGAPQQTPAAAAPAAPAQAAAAQAGAAPAAAAQAGAAPAAAGTAAGGAAEQAPVPVPVPVPVPGEPQFGKQPAHASALASAAQPASMAATPAFLPVAKPAGPKPAFVSVGIPASRPAAAAAVAPPTAAMSAAALPASVVGPSAAAGRQQTAPPLWLDAAGRKRKKPAGARVAQQQQAAVEAEAGPKSWVDWLQLGSAGSGSGLAGGPAQQQKQQALRGQHQQQQKLGKRRKGR